MPWIKSERDMSAAVKVMDEFAYGIIKERRQDPDIGDKTGKPKDHNKLHSSFHHNFENCHLCACVYCAVVRVRWCVSTLCVWCVCVCVCGGACAVVRVQICCRAISR
jgi:hypothetical protein